MISEGESDLVLSKHEYDSLMRIVQSIFDIAGELSNGLGKSNGRLYYAWWADSIHLLHHAKRGIVELSTARAIITRVRQDRGNLFRQEPHVCPTDGPARSEDGDDSDMDEHRRRSDSSGDYEAY